MNIVILDGGGIGDDFDWPDFEALGAVTRYNNSAPGEIAGRIKDAEAVLTNKAVLTAKLIAGAQRLKYIGCLATGFNHVDIAAAAARGIPVTNVPDYSSAAVAQHVFALILHFTNGVDLHNRAVQNGEWSNSEYFCFWKQPIVELEGKTLGIVGFGNIGRRVAAIGAAFGMRVLAHAHRPPKDAMAAPPYPGFSFAGLEEVFSEADFITLHTPLTPQTNGMVNSRLLARMKKSAYLINTARGPLVKGADLAAAIREGRIAGAGLDVVEVEPMPPDSPLLGLPGVVITPHIAWASVEARSRLMQGVYANLEAFLKGKPTNVVNGAGA